MGVEIEIEFGDNNPSSPRKINTKAIIGANYPVCLPSRDPYAKLGNQCLIPLIPRIAIKGLDGRPWRREPEAEFLGIK